MLARFGVELGFVPNGAASALEEQVGAFAAGKFGLGAEGACHLILPSIICCITGMQEPSGWQPVGGGLDLKPDGGQRLRDCPDLTGDCAQMRRRF
jgi:hypothetical protein